MSASLVGSEMCIRDRPRAWQCRFSGGCSGPPSKDHQNVRLGPCFHGLAVSYTHLTLPTICSV
eukprot:10826083-Alexandrium_andersonii.AAC.1